MSFIVAELKAIELALDALRNAHRVLQTIVTTNNRLARSNIKLSRKILELERKSPRVYHYVRGSLPIKGKVKLRENDPGQIS